MAFREGSKELRDCHKCNSHWTGMEFQGPVTHMGYEWIVICNVCEHEGPSASTYEEALKAYQKEWIHPKRRTNYIKIEDLEVGRAYRVWARNFDYALWTGKNFAGTRSKFSDVFIDSENHWDEGPPHGTVKPLKLLQ